MIMLDHDYPGSSLKYPHSAGNFLGTMLQQLLETIMLLKKIVKC